MYHLPKENFFSRYTRLIEGVEPVAALVDSQNLLHSYNLHFLEQLGDKVYAENKWTVKQIFQHLIDTERIMSYRALRFARNDATLLPGFDEEHFAEFALVHNRDITEVIQEYQNLRISTIDLFRSFGVIELERKGLSFKQEVTVGSIAYIIAGHQYHHWNVIQERYMLLL